MNFGINPYTTDFILLSPIVAVFVRHQQNLKMLVVVAFGCVLASGLLLFVGDAWLDQQWLSLLAKVPNPSAALIGEFNTDSASKAATLILGFPLSLAYFLLCFLVVRSAKWFREKTCNNQ